MEINEISVKLHGFIIVQTRFAVGKQLVNGANSEVQLEKAKTKASG